MSSRDELKSQGKENAGSARELEEVKIFLPADLARAWQRCSWLIVHETGQPRAEIMAEMVRDFLIKHGC